VIKVSIQLSCWKSLQDWQGQTGQIPHPEVERCHVDAKVTELLQDETHYIVMNLQVSRFAM
jgi:hypothetical protein